MNNQPIDECLTRSAIRNLRMYVDGFDESKLATFKVKPPTIPKEVLEWFAQADAKGEFDDIELRQKEE